jgi:hypothetical protein
MAQARPKQPVQQPHQYLLHTGSASLQIGEADETEVEMFGYSQIQQIKTG